MPLKPGKDESQSEFISRCASEMADANPDWDNDRVVAACYSIWREAKPKAMANGIVHKTSSIVDGNHFILSDESVDREGDIVNAQGWDLRNFEKNPICLFAHRSDFPIGKWHDVKLSDDKKQLRGRLELAPKGTSPRIDEIRKLVEHGILKSTSVGFRTIEIKPRPEGGHFFKRQELVECSLVAVPANPNALSTAKSLNISAPVHNMVFAKSGDEDHVAERRVIGTPAARNASSRRNAAMVPIAQRIIEAETKIVSLTDQLNEHLDKLDNSDVSDVEMETSNELNAQLVQAKKLRDMLKETEKNIGNGSDGSGQLVPSRAARHSPRPFGLPTKKVEPLELLVRAGVIQVVARSTGKPPEIIRQMVYGDDEATRVVYDWTQRAATAPAMTTVTGWAAELVQQINADFMALLRPKSVFPRLAAKGLSLNFGNAGRIAIPTRSATPTIAGSFVGEGQPIPVRQGAFTAQILTPKKLAVITTWTREISEHSVPAIEGLLREAIQEDTAVALDSILLDANAATAVRPAGLFNGVAPLTATAGANLDAFVGDIKKLAGAVLTATNGNIRSLVWLMNPQQVLSAGLLSQSGLFPFKDEVSGGNLMGFNIIDSGTVPLGTVAVVDAADFVSVGAEGPRFEISDQATLHMEDTSPAPIGSGSTVASPARSLWQTDSLALRLIYPMNWVVRRVGVTAWLQSATW